MRSILPVRRIVINRPVRSSANSAFLRKQNALAPDPDERVHPK
jgi:hypothetical protein